MSEKIFEMKKKKEEPSVSDILLELYCYGVACLGSRFLKGDVNAVSVVITPSDKDHYVNVIMGLRHKDMKIEHLVSKEIDTTNDDALTDDDILNLAYTILNPLMN